MGKFLEGFEGAHKAAEERDAAARRRAERIAEALKKLSDKLAEDREALEGEKITMRIEHGALVLRRVLQPMAGVSFDPDSGRFNIHRYSVSEGKNEMEAADIEECALRLGEYAYSLKGSVG
jgi:hypothetical protein